MARMNGILGVVVCAVVVLLVALVGWFGLVSPQRSKADKLSGEVATAKSALSSDQTLLATARRENTTGRAQAAKRALPARRSTTSRRAPPSRSAPRRRSRSASSSRAATSGCRSS
jgi:hypothetical protein